MFGFDDGEAGKDRIIEIGFLEGESGDLVVVVGRVVESAFVEIITRGVKGAFVFVVAEVTAAVLLIDGMENVEELADARKLVVGRNGI